MQNPYKPWQISERMFPANGSLEEQAKFLIHFALLAPSSHNTQPWKFSVTQNIISIQPDLTRVLHYADRTHRELYISLGCALANIEISAAYFNLHTETEYLPEDTLDNTAIRIKLSRHEAGNKTLSNFFPYITERRTSRFHYLEKEIPQKIIDELSKINTFSDITTHFITSYTIRHKILELIVNTSLEVFKDKVFKDELSEWIRSVYTKQLDGMPLFDMGMPGISTIFASTMIKHIPAKMQADLDRKQFGSAPVYLVISSKHDKKIDWIHSGKVFQMIALVATKNGLSFAPWAGLIEHETAPKELQKIIHTDERPEFFARLGYSPVLNHHSPRRGLAMVLTQ